jgi:hypothetical protein
LKVRVLLLPIIIYTGLLAEPTVNPPDFIVEHYCAATRAQSQALKDASMEVEIAASLPKLKKQGKLHALRRISALGRITYSMLRFEGDGTIKSQVITRYLTAEADAQRDQPASLSVTPENYKFKYKGQASLDGRPVHIFQVTPKQKRQGLYKGDLWIDAATYLRVQESGYLVKNPSIFLKRIAFTRRYEIRNGISVPRQIQTEIETRLVGKAELTIDYSHFSLDDPQRVVAGDTDGQ